MAPWYFTSIGSYKKFAIVSIKNDKSSKVKYYFCRHNCDGSIQTKVRRSIEACKRDVDKFWQKYGLCPDLQKLLNSSSKRGLVSIKSKCDGRIIRGKRNH